MNEAKEEKVLCLFLSLNSRFRTFIEIKRNEKGTAHERTKNERVTAVGRRVGGQVKGKKTHFN